MEDFDRFTKLAQSSIDRNGDDFENIMEQLFYVNGNVYFAHDHFIIEEFNFLSSLPKSAFIDGERYEYLISQGKQFKAKDKIDDLKDTVFALRKIKKRDNKYKETSNVNIRK